MGTSDDAGERGGEQTEAEISGDHRIEEQREAQRNSKPKSLQGVGISLSLSPFSSSRKDLPHAIFLMFFSCIQLLFGLDDLLLLEREMGRDRRNGEGG
jgi:hypothetical protein